MHIIRDVNMPLPRINMNGTSMQELMKQLRAVAEAAQSLSVAMRQANPHPRDYQTIEGGDSLCRAAQADWRELTRMVEDLQEFVSERAYTINMNG